MLALKRINTIIDRSIKRFNNQNSFWIRSLTVSYVNNSDNTNVPSKIIQPKKNLSKAMKAYLERAREHDEFMKQQSIEFQIGKRHLANMMGENPDTFTQDDINEAIAYLFPSGLFESRARPFMKPPEEVYPVRKAAEFDETGRPHHVFFYTGTPNYTKLIYDAIEYMNELYKFQDVMIRKGLEPDPNVAIELTGYQWIDKELIEKKLLEKISDRDYDNFVSTMERLMSLPYSYKYKDFIHEYRKPLASQTETYEAPKPQYDADGRAYITTYECKRKRAIATVTLRSPGTGKITINGQDITYFEEMQCREQILFPLLFSDMINKIDVEAEVSGGGHSGQSGAIRYGISWGLRSFLDQDTIEKMRLAGLLQPDLRYRERKKPGQKKARKKFTWKKR